MVKTAALETANAATLTERRRSLRRPQTTLKTPVATTIRSCAHRPMIAFHPCRLHVLPCHPYRSHVLPCHPHRSCSLPRWSHISLHRLQVRPRHPRQSRAHPHRSQLLQHRHCRSTAISLLADHNHATNAFADFLSRS
ncbi:uncharacterized protein LOC110631353 isoform X2 [Manihot esculenta]|uniref:uncharacterized protein LOC110631353 isoform X2 n=1 Tax=Manihot esculenta TaxID=3983 RepID=UPI000B5D6441|nr:uncharacterized protein LOC110631353 isoform X2 [Manihot esculenta]